MTIRTGIKAGGGWTNHNETMKVRCAVKAGYAGNHNETLQVRSGVKAGALNSYLKLKDQKSGDIASNHNESLRIRSAVKAGIGEPPDRLAANHNETPRVRSTVKAGAATKLAVNHNESARRAAVSDLRPQLKPIVRKQDRLRLMVVRAGLRAGQTRSRGIRSSR